MVDRAAAEHEKLRGRLVERMTAAGALPDRRIADAFRTVPRHVFLPGVGTEAAYSDEAIVIKSGADGSPLSSSSEPGIMALMLGQLGVEPGDCVLEIGAGTGFNAAIMAQLVGKSGSVTAVEIDRSLCRRARACLRACGFDRVEVICADGAAGFSPRAPYDRVIATVGVWDLEPAWIEQLRPGGRLVVPLSLRGAQCSIAFEHRGADMVSVSARQCGFMRMRGSSAGPGRILPLGPEAELFVELDEDRPLDAEALYAALQQPGEETPTGVRCEASELRGGLFLWLSLHEPDLALLGATGAGDVQGGAAGAPPTSRQAWTVALVGRDALAAAFANSRAGQPSRSGAMDVVVRAFGTAAERLADKLANGIRGWEAAGRPSTSRLRITALRPGSPVPEGATIVKKIHTRLAVELS